MRRPLPGRLAPHAALACRVGLAACVLAWLATPAAAQEPPGAAWVGRTATTVRVETEGREVVDPAIVDLVETRRGEPLSLVQVRESITHLFNLGRFQDVQVEATADGDGVALRYLLVPLRAVRGVVFRGTTGLAPSRLRRVLGDQFGGTPTLGRATAAARALEDACAAAGYLKARVVPSVELVPGSNEPLLTFDIAAGPRARIGDIAVTGSVKTPRAALLDRLGLRSGDFYDRHKLNRGLSRYVADQRDRGYYEAEADHTLEVREEAAVVDVTLDVNTGPLVVVSFDGDPLPADRLEEFVPVAREGSADEDLLEDSDRRIVQYLHEQGYWQAEVSHRRTTADGRLDIVFTVKRGLPFAVAGVEIVGNRHVPASELRPLVRAKVGEPFVQSRFDADVAAIERYYEQLGYARAKVDFDPGAGTAKAAGLGVAVTPRITIEEGPRIIISRVRLEGLHAFDEPDLRAVMGSTPGRPYNERQTADDRNAMAELYLNRGYESAQVQIAREFAPDQSSVDLLFAIQEGPQSIVDHILIVGNNRTKTSTIERELVLRRGDPFGLAAIIESQLRLSALGLFRRVRISSIEHGAGTRKDLLVAVEEAPATSIGYGGGLEGARRLRTNPEGGPAEERIEFAPRGFFEIGRRNLWGKNRSVNLFTRVSMRPSDDPGAATVDDQSGRFTEYRLIGSYREPRAFSRDVDIVAGGVLEQGVRTSFNFNRKGISAEFLRRLTPSLRASARYGFDYTRRFDERIDPADQSLIDRLFPEVGLSKVSGSLFHDTRNDVVEPTRGGWISTDLELAARTLGSEVGFVKGYLQAFRYRTLYERGDRRLVLALGARVGMAAGFLRTVEVQDEQGHPIIGPDGRPQTVRVDDVPASERFFAGGDTTVRGFTLDRLGTPETIDSNGFPKGGNGMVILNGELRVNMLSWLGVVTFLDAGNVYARAPDIDFSEMRPAAGFGLRLQSPVGPVRVDLGFKLDRQVGEKLTALYVSFGQAF